MNREFRRSLFSTTNKDICQFDDRPPYILVRIGCAEAYE